MTTTTRKPAPTTAAEAEALAARLAAEERDLADRKRAARQAAEIAACRDLLDTEADQLAQAANTARLALDAAVDDDSVLLPELFILWTNLRRASAVRATHVAQASSRWDALDPIRHPVGGGPVTHRLDTHDYLEPRGEMTWSLFVEATIQKRALNAADQTRDAITARIRQAGTDAAEAVT